MQEVVTPGQLLKGKLVEKNTNVSDLAEKLGIGTNTLYYHINNGNFTISEVARIKDILGLSNDEVIRIFFG